MNEFFWVSGHMGAGLFTLAIFTGIWWLLSDLVWRLRNIRISRFLIMMSIGWIIGVGLILLGVHLDYL